MTTPNTTIPNAPSDDDRRWFTEHPGERMRYRPMFPNEFGVHTRDIHADVPPGAEVIIEITQYAPGIRSRRAAYWVLPQSKGGA